MHWVGVLMVRLRDVSGSRAIALAPAGGGFCMITKPNNEAPDAALPRRPRGPNHRELSPRIVPVI